MKNSVITMLVRVHSWSLHIVVNGPPSLPPSRAAARDGCGALRRRASHLCDVVSNTPYCSVYTSVCAPNALPWLYIMFVDVPMILGAAPIHVEINIVVTNVLDIAVSVP